MKKSVFTLLLALCFGALFGQSNHLQHVIVMMAERYDDSQLSQKTALMTKEQRRDFVIAERKAFCQASQTQVLDFLEGYKSENLVIDLKPSGRSTASAARPATRSSHNLLSAKMLP